MDAKGVKGNLDVVPECAGSFADAVRADWYARKRALYLMPTRRHCPANHCPGYRRVCRGL